MLCPFSLAPEPRGRVSVCERRHPPVARCVLRMAGIRRWARSAFPTSVRAHACPYLRGRLGKRLRHPHCGAHAFTVSSVFAERVERLNVVPAEVEVVARMVDAEAWFKKAADTVKALSSAQKLRE